MTKKKNPHWGSTLDDFLTEEGNREAFEAVAIKEGLSLSERDSLRVLKLLEHPPKPNRRLLRAAKTCASRDLPSR
jgi:uncharacterized protein (DUF1778 family)